jgi:hypothetical protein
VPGTGFTGYALRIYDKDNTLLNTVTGSSSPITWTPGGAPSGTELRKFQFDVTDAASNTTTYHGQFIFQP